MLRIITTKRLNGLKHRIEELQGLYYGEKRWKDIARQDASIAQTLRIQAEKKNEELDKVNKDILRQIINLEKKVREQREKILELEEKIKKPAKKTTKQRKKK